MKVRTNVNPGKKKKTSTSQVFEKADVQASKKFKKDSESAKKYDDNLKKTAKGFTVKTGRVTSGNLAASGSYTGVAAKSSHNEQARVKGLKQTGYYDAKPAVVGGTKKMVRISKKNVKKSGASSQAKKAAKKLY